MDQFAKIVRWRKPALVLFTTILLCTGCSWGPNRSPEEVLALAISGLHGTDNLAFTGMSYTVQHTGIVQGKQTFQGRIEGHKLAKLESGRNTATLAALAQDQAQSAYYNPLEVMERLQQSKQAVRKSSTQAGRGATMLQIDADPAKAAALVAEQLQSELEQAASQLQSDVGEQEQPAWRSQLDQYREELSGMLSSLQVATTYDLVVDPIRSLPTQLTETRILQYNYQGKERNEKQVITITFDVGSAEE